MLTGHELTDEIVYGPVVSRRLGVTLGINLSPKGAKYCNFNCVYCQLGFNDPGYTPSREDFPTVTAVTAALRDARSEGLWGRDNSATATLVISGNGEPTLHPFFPEITRAILSLRNEISPATRVIAFTNGARLGDESLFDALDELDECHLKFDPDPETVNAPDPDFSLHTLFGQALRLSNPVLQSCLIRCKNRPPSARLFDVWARRVALIKPRRVDLYTLARVPASSQVSPASSGDFATAETLLREHGVANISISADPAKFLEIRVPG